MFPVSLVAIMATVVTREADFSASAGHVARWGLWRDYSGARASGSRKEATPEATSGRTLHAVTMMERSWRVPLMRKA